MIEYAVDKYGVLVKAKKINSDKSEKVLIDDTKEIKKYKQNNK